MNGKATAHMSIAHERKTQNHCKHNACSLTSHCIRETQKCQLRQYEIYENQAFFLCFTPDSSLGLIGLDSSK